jgi:hypothetical protein
MTERRGSGVAAARGGREGEKCMKIVALRLQIIGPNHTR